MRKQALLYVLLLFTTLSFAQMPKFGAVNGTVIDAETEQPVAYATVTIKSAADEKVITGGLTQENGTFMVNELPPGELIAEVSFIGYDSKNFPITINRETPSHNLGTISLGVDTAALDAVVVEGEGSAVRYEVDKKIYDASKIKAAEGGNAKDVLQNIPSITVDDQANIQLRGSQNVRVLINGRPSSFSLQTLLEQTPQKNIQEIEIITNPSAKYDAEGEAGIINIILKENNIEGFTGGVNVSYGTEDKYNLGTNLGLKTKKWNLSSSVNYNRFEDNFFRDINRVFVGETINQVTDENRDFVRRGVFGKIGIDHYFDDKNTLFLSGSINPGRGDNDANSLNTNVFTKVPDILNPGSFLVPADSYNYTRNNTGESDNNGYEVTAGFQHDIKGNPRHNFLIDFSHNVGEQEQLNSFTSIYPGIVSPVLDRDFTDQDNSTTLISADYTNPFDGKRKLELGYKSTLESKDQTFSVTPQYFVSNPTQTTVDRLDFNQDIHAGYVTYEQTFGKVGVKGGLRGEFTDVASIVEGAGTYVDDYLQLFPTANFNYNLNEKTNFNLGYSRRINRPNARQLTPFADRSDPNNQFIGNNTLRPELTNSYELGFNKQFENSGISTAVYHRNVNDHIRYARSTGEPGVSSITFENVNNLNVYGAEASYDFSLSKWWSVITSGNYNYGKIADAGDDTELNNASTSTFSGNLSNNFRFQKGWGGQLGVNYQSPFDYYEGRLGAMWAANISAYKGGLMKGKGSAFFRFSDMFNTQGLNIDYKDDIQSQSIELDWPSQMAFIGFNYNFGNLKKPTKRKMKRKEEKGETQPGLGF